MFGFVGEAGRQLQCSLQDVAVAVLGREAEAGMLSGMKLCGLPALALGRGAAGRWDVGGCSWSPEQPWLPAWWWASVMCWCLSLCPSSALWIEPLALAQALGSSVAAEIPSWGQEAPFWATLPGNPPLCLALPVLSFRS